MDSTGALLPDGATLRRVDVGTGVSLQVVEMGGGPLVVLLHGFPEYWYSWRRQIPALARAGFRVVAPNMRGYPGSDKPRGVRAYTVPRLVDDLAGLVRTLGEERCRLVAHDWGGPPAWELARARPQMVEKLAVINAPPPRGYGRMVRRSWRQAARAWYVLAFQLPVVPELALKAAGGWMVDRSQRRAGATVEVNPPQVRRCYARAFSEPGVATAAVHYYRAAVRVPREKPTGPRKVAAPTLVIWGDADPYLVEALAGEEALRRDVEGPLKVVHLPGVGHLAQQQAPEEVNRLLVEFLRS